jgi:acetyltransferase/esterase
LSPAIIPGFAEAPACRLYYERRGSGPALVMVAGGGGDCGAYSPLASILATEYTVITYDRRGNSRSVLQGPPVRITIKEQSDDAVAVLRANGFETASFFGNSGGATIVLDVAVNHPDAVEKVVPHEPPIPNVLSDAEEVLAAFRQVERTLSREGWEAAFEEFALFNNLIPKDDPDAMTPLLHPDRVLAPGDLRDLLTREKDNWPYMLKYEVPSFAEYHPQLAEVLRNQTRIALVAGVESREMYYYKAAPIIALELGVEFMEFHGGHTATLEIPEMFAQELMALLERL